MLENSKLEELKKLVRVHPQTGIISIQATPEMMMELMSSGVLQEACWTAEGQGQAEN